MPQNKSTPNPPKPEPNLGPNFYPKLIKISNELGMKPEDILLVMVSESGINPSSTEKVSHGSGLIGFMPATLKSLGFQGTWEDFIKTSGEFQLDYVKKFLQPQIAYNGQPFQSLAHYYTAVFYPAALKLPGVKRGDLSTRFIELNPATVTATVAKKEEDGTTTTKDVKYSKKYYDVGIKLPVENEIAAFKANPLFHKTTKEAITLGDMATQVENNRRSPIYKKALAELEKAKGTPYEEKKEVVPDGTTKSDSASPAASNNKNTDSVFNKYLGENKTTMDKDMNSKENVFERFLGKDNDQKTPSNAPVKNEDVMMDKIDSLLKASSKRDNKKLAKNNFLVKVKANKVEEAVEFGRIFCSVLDEELLANGSIHIDNDKVEIECELFGPKSECLFSLNQMLLGTKIAFFEATKKIGSVCVDADVFINKTSSYQPISIDFATANYRKFLTKFLKGS